MTKGYEFAFCGFGKSLIIFPYFQLLTSWNEDIIPKATRSKTQKATQTNRNLQNIEFKIGSALESARSSQKSP